MTNEDASVVLMPVIMLVSSLMVLLLSVFESDEKDEEMNSEVFLFLLLLGVDVAGFTLLEDERWCGDIIDKLLKSIPVDQPLVLLYCWL